MVNQQLVSYFHEWLQKGYTLDELKSELLNQGYPQNEVEAAAQMANQPPLSPQIPHPPSSPTFQRDYYPDRKNLSDEKPYLILKPKIIAGILPKFISSFIVLTAISGWLLLQFWGVFILFTSMITFFILAIIITIITHSISCSYICGC